MKDIASKYIVEKLVGTISKIIEKLGSELFHENLQTFDLTLWK